MGSEEKVRQEAILQPDSNVNKPDTTFKEGK